MQALWTEHESSFSGAFFELPPVHCYPKPFTRPYPPIWMGAGGPNLKNLPGLRRAVRFASGWFPMPGITLREVSEGAAKLAELCAEAGRNVADIEVIIPIDAKELLGLGSPAEVASLVEEYAAAGVHRLIPFSLDFPKRGGEDQLREIAGRLSLS